jgi:hypothetical protein
MRAIPRSGTTRAFRIGFLSAALLLAPALGAAREETPICVIAEDDRPRRIEEIRDAIARYSAVSSFPIPQLEDERLADLLNGEVVRFREKWVLSREGDKESERTRQRALAYRLVAAPRTHVWISALDPHFPLNDDLIEHRMEADDRGSSTWYQFFDLPWPVRNRHWVIRVKKGVDVAEATEGRAWEHSWSLVLDGESAARDFAAAGKVPPLSLDDVMGARYLEANDGAWAMIALDEKLTLLAYNLTIVLGGWIPEGMASRFAMRALEDLLDRVAAGTEPVPGHYVAGHEPIFGGDALPIEPFPAPAAA